jgi:hypothetical protein
MGKQKGRISKGGFPSRPTIGTFSPSITEHFLTGGDTPPTLISFSYWREEKEEEE